MENTIAGNKVSLRPASLNDRRQVYEWLALSDITTTMLGTPHFSGNKAPSWDQFVNEYSAHFFDGSRPLDGRSFIILLDNESIGQINYNKVRSGTTELDIWLAAARYTGKGYGSDAIVALCKFLQDQLELKKCYIAPSRRNQHAIDSYKKAGFNETMERPIWFIPRYEDTVIMVKELVQEIRI